MRNLDSQCPDSSHEAHIRNSHRIGAIRNSVQWFEAELPVGLDVRQVYGFIFGVDGRVLLFEDKGKFNLPGGKPEDGESLVETLLREVLEEVQVRISACEYLGHQLVEGIETFAQVRLMAVIHRFLPADKDPSTGRKYLRLLAPPAELNELLGWGEAGERQIARAVSLASRVGVTWNGTPRSYIDANNSI